MQTKKRYNIGLVIGNIEDVFPNQICKGAMKAAEEKDVNLFIFPAKPQISVKSLLEQADDLLYEDKHRKPPFVVRDV